MRFVCVKFGLKCIVYGGTILVNNSKSIKKKKKLFCAFIDF